EVLLAPEALPEVLETRAAAREQHVEVLAIARIRRRADREQHRMLAVELLHAPIARERAEDLLHEQPPAEVIGLGEQQPQLVVRDLRERVRIAQRVLQALDERAQELAHLLRGHL